MAAETLAGAIPPCFPMPGLKRFGLMVWDANGRVLATQIFLPTSVRLIAQSLTVSFPGAGDYTLRFTELGPDDSLGAILDNINL